jgi:hypothetical protein
MQTQSTHLHCLRDIHLVVMCALIARIRPLDINFRVFSAANIRVFLFWVVKPENTN